VAVRVVGDEYAFVMPDRIKGGTVTMDIANSGREPHEFGLARIDPGKTAADVQKALAKSGENAPKWLHDIGGVPPITPGERLSITRRLTPGTYAFICFLPSPTGKPHYALGMQKAFTVAGDNGARAPRTDGAIVAGRKSISVVGAVRPGRRTYELRNAAESPHGFFILSYAPGKTMRDLDRWAGKSFAGPAPARLVGGIQSIPGGTSVYMTADFETGRTYTVLDDDGPSRTTFTPR
jgi:hypothetical protein